jgi:hypothetical protein
MPQQYVVFPDPGGPITTCPNGMLSKVFFTESKHLGVFHTISSFSRVFLHVFEFGDGSVQTPNSRTI